jgi:hypothetical protein
VSFGIRNQCRVLYSDPSNKCFYIYYDKVFETGFALFIVLHESGNSLFEKISDCIIGQSFRKD